MPLSSLPLLPEGLVGLHGWLQRRGVVVGEGSQIILCVAVVVVSWRHARDLCLLSCLLRICESTLVNNNRYL